MRCSFPRGLRVALGFIATIAAVHLPARPAAAADAVFDAKGFNPNREFVSDLGFEHIDPLTGNLLLTFTDLTLPGNASFDLRVQRTYNTKIYAAYQGTGGGGGTFQIGENDPAGLGWTMHFGKLTNLQGGPDFGPVIEMADGSSHPSYRHSNSSSSTAFMTRDLWTIDRVGAPCDFGGGTCPLLRLPNGTRYVFSHGNRSTGPLWVTSIRDPFGNQITIDYEPYVSGAPAYLESVTQSFGQSSRTVTFDYLAALPGGASVKRLRTMTFAGRVWTYNQEALGTGAQPRVTVLTSVAPPEPPSWQFEYYNPPAFPKAYLMKKVTTPHGGTVAYDYQSHQFFYGSSAPFTPVISTRTTGGADVVAGQTTYSFPAQGPTQPVTAIVSEPCNRVTTYETFAIGPMGSEMPWRIGAMKSKRVVGGGADQLETYVWQRSMPISDVPESGNSTDTHVPLLQSRTITRDGSTYVTTHSYNESVYSTSNPRSFNDYGNPSSTVASGHVGRTTTRTFFHPAGNSEISLGNYIAGRVEAETVTVAGETFGKSFSWRTNGFLERDNRYGIATDFLPDSFGNVGRRSVENGPATTFEWKWGVPERIRTPLHPITRTVESDSTISRETIANRTRRFLYDGLYRPERITPPLGDFTSLSYAANGRTVTVARGDSATTTVLDGFGRASATNNNVGVQTDTNYDACGRVQFRSYPFTSLTTGETFGYDALDRVRTVTKQGSPPISYAYPASANALVVRITDEEGRVTDQSWHAFGAPEDARLASVLDAGSGTSNARLTTTYSYNALGSLTRVDAPLGGDRAWTYDSRGLLQTESHPESGTVSYTYYNDGQVETRSDAAFGTSRFNYDANDRLVEIVRPGDQPDTGIGYEDGSDNRDFLRHGGVVSRLGPYDGNNRLRKRVDTINGAPFTTSYDYDSRDNVEWVFYPSGSAVRYRYDSENRIVDVTNGGSAVFANQFTHHPSGGFERYVSGNGIVNDIDYNPNRYWITQAKAGAAPSANSLFQTNYGHDDVGNVETTADSRTGSYTYGYDPVDRLRFATGGAPAPQSWGNLAFTYDAIGNRKTKTRLGQTVTYGYDGDNRLQSVTAPEPATFGYDANGNTTSDGVGGYTFNADNMIATATVNGTVTSYAYDADGLRKLKRGGGVSHYYVHGPGNQILTELERGASPHAPLLPRDYVYAGTRLVASVRPPTLVVAPRLLVFAGVRNGPSPAAKTVSISEAAGESIAWQASESLPWLTIAPTSGSSTPATMNASVDTTGLNVGTYVGTITVTAPAGAVGSPQTIDVRLVVTNVAGLVVQPDSLRFDVTEGEGDPPPAELQVLVSGGPEAGWTATTSDPWVAVAPANGTTPSAVAATVDAMGRPAGTYRGWVRISAGTTPGSPRTVPVTLTVRPAAGGTCAPDAWFCEPFEGREEGDLGGQGPWEDELMNSLVEFDPRGAGKSGLLDPPPDDQSNDIALFSGNPPISGSSISVQVMTEGVPEESKQVAKLEFFTADGQGWGKSGRAFGVLRFGSALNFQYQPNVYQVLLDRMEPGRWYDVRAEYLFNWVNVYVDGELKFRTVASVGTLPVQAFAMTAWDFPGAAHVDLIQGRPPRPGLIVQPLALAFTATATTPVASAAAPAKKSVHEAYAKLPLSFEANRGQVEGDVRFLARGRGYNAFVSPRDIVLAAGRGREPEKRSVVRMSFPGASAETRVSGVDEQPGKSHYYVGNDPSRWRTNVPHYAKVRYEELYPGVDVVLYGNPRQLEYDIVVAPGADPGVVRLAFEGAQDLRLDGRDLVVQTAAGEIRQLKPVVYQEVAGERRVLEGDYELRDGLVGFRVAAYDRSLPLVLDPVVLVYSTYLGDGTVLEDSGNAIAVDDDESAFVVGTTMSLDFPVANAAQDASFGTPDAFVTKFNASGSALVFSTYLGGHGSDYGMAAIVDTQGNVHAGGHAEDTFPQVEPIQAGIAGEFDGFVAKLSPEGQLLFSSFIGGEANDEVKSLAFDGQGELYAAGITWSTAWLWTSDSFSKVNQDLPTAAGFVDSFVARVTGDATYLTYLNGNNVDPLAGLAVDGAGYAYAGGSTNSTPLADTVRNPFPAAAGAFQKSLEGESDLFVTKLDPTGGVVQYSTYVGGTENEGGGALAIEPGCSSTCAAYVVGATSSSDFPEATAPPWRRLLGPIVVKLAPNGGSLVYSTGVGGTSVGSIAVDANGSAYAAGHSNLTGYPSDAPVCDQDLLITELGKGFDVYVVKLDASGGSADFCALIGGDPPNEVAHGIALSPLGSAYVTGLSRGDRLPTTPGAFMTEGDNDAFVIKLSDTSPPVARMFFSDNAYEIAESGGEAIITVDRSGDLSSQSSVNFNTSDGSASSQTDYKARNLRLTFQPGETAQSVTVPIAKDEIPEGDETVNLWLSAPIDGVLGVPSSSVLTIIEDEGTTRTILIRDRLLSVGPNWTAVTDAPWLSLDLGSGTGPSYVTATADPTGLAPGTYTTFIRVDGDTGDSPQFVDVTLTITEAP
jgi:YD repeat-containing protein